MKVGKELLQRVNLFMKKKKSYFVNDFERSILCCSIEIKSFLNVMQTNLKAFLHFGTFVVLQSCSFEMQSSDKKIFKNSSNVVKSLKVVIPNCQALNPK